jgi:hypothetical protein
VRVLGEEHAARDALRDARLELAHLVGRERAPVAAEPAQLVELVPRLGEPVGALATTTSPRGSKPKSSPCFVASSAVSARLASVSSRLSRMVSCARCAVAARMKPSSQRSSASSARGFT